MTDQPRRRRRSPLRSSTRLTRRALSAAAFALVALLSVAARAQDVPWNPYGLTAYREGPGFRLGEAPLVIHPGLSAEFGYDSNVFYLPQNAVGAPLMRLRAHLDLAPIVKTEADAATAVPKLDFRVSTQLEYREFLAGSDAVRAQRGVLFVFGGYLTVFPYGRLSLRIDEDLIRTVDPRNAEGLTNFARVYNRAGLTLTGRAGNGRLEIGVADHVSVQVFENDDVSFGNNIQNDARLFAHWRMFPNVLLGLTARVGYITYENNPQLEAVPLRVRAEATAQFTRWLGATLALGYGNSLALRSARFNSALSQEEVRFNLPKGILIALGHQRDFRDSVFASFYANDRVYLTYAQPFLYRIRFYAEAAINFRHYEGLIDPALVGAVAYSSDERDDQVYEARVGLTVQCLRWLVVGAHYNFLADRTDFRFLRADGSSLAVEYMKHSAFAQIDVAY